MLVEVEFVNCPASSKTLDVTYQSYLIGEIRY